jgi:hypothetical protein
MNSTPWRWGASLVVLGLVGCAGDATTALLPPDESASSATPALASPISPAHPSDAVSAQAPGVSPEDVIIWTARGQRDEAIIERIELSGCSFKMCAADENRLRDAGVSETVIRYMKHTSQR